LNAAQRRAIWAITHCRTPVMGGSLHVCACGESHFLHHSCNHRSCPQCGKADTAGWVALELSKRVGATYFMVTFTLPSQLRYLFFTEHAKAMYDVFFSAAVAALSGQLAHPKYLGALISGITAVLQTWTQVLGFHPHLHCIVPGAGISASGKVVALKNGKYLVHQPTLCRAFRQEFRERLAALGIRVDPAVWELDWGIHIQPFGDGSNAIRYLGRYVCRTAIGDSRIVAADEHLVTIRYNDRDRGDIVREETMPGVEFVRRYLLHVLPPGLRDIRRYGFCHPASKRNRERVAVLRLPSQATRSCGPDMVDALSRGCSTRADRFSRRRLPRPRSRYRFARAAASPRASLFACCPRGPPVADHQRRRHDAHEATYH